MVCARVGRKKIVPGKQRPAERSKIKMSEQGTEDREPHGEVSVIT